MINKRSKLDSLQLILLGILLGLLAAGIILIVSAPPRGIPLSIAPMPTPEPIMVHVDGAVASPGVYSLPPGSRVQDVIAAAGGFIETANSQSINLARTLHDGEQVTVSETTSSQPDTPLPPHANQDSPEHVEEQIIFPININTAQAEDFENLPGIGPQRALDIITYREINGPFERIEDIKEVNGIAEGTFAQIKEFISVKP